MLSLETTRRSPETAFYIERQHRLWSLEHFILRDDLSNVVNVRFICNCTFDPNRGVTVHRIHGSVCTSDWGSCFRTISVHQKKKER